MIFFKNTHYCFPFPIPLFYLFSKHYTKTVIIQFNESIRYDIGTEQSDVNKLFGIGYGWHHNQSDRIGFRYNKEKDQVEIVLYSYVLGNRIPTMHIAYVDINEKVEINLSIHLKEGFRTVYAGVKRINEYYIIKEFKYEKKLVHYSLGGYFGGNRKAPHKIKINYQTVY